MRCSRSLLLVLFAVVCLAGPLETALAAVTSSGDVDPFDPTTWTTSTYAYVGKTDEGSVTVDSGSTIESYYGYLGYASTATGQVTVDGSDSTWTNSSCFFIGCHGNGTLDVTGGGALNSGGYEWYYYEDEELGGYYIGESYNAYIGCFSGSTGVVAVNGSGSTWTNSSSLGVGSSGNGTLNITNGGHVTSGGKYYYEDEYGQIYELYCDSRIGSSSGSTGVVTVSGDGSTWTNSDSLRVGYSGEATLNITDGGAVSSSSASIGDGSSSTGAVTVDGSGSTWTNSGYHLHVGRYGSGTLNITDGGAVSSGSASIGYGSSSTGAVTVSGASSTLTNSGKLYVGHYGSGTLAIIGGGAVSNDSGYIGYESGSTGEVMVDGSGSKWTNGDFSELHVGHYGSGTLTITGGGAVSNNFGHIGYASGSTGEVMVSGADSTWTNSGHLYIGDEGSGTLNITDGGSVTVSSRTYVAYDTGSTGTINFGTSGGTLTTRSLYASPTQMTGTGTINTRGLVSDADLVFDSAASLSRTLTFNSQPDQNVTVNLDMASDPSSNGDLGAGWKGNGSLTIRDGITVNSLWGYIGSSSGSMGQATVTGTGSTWANIGSLYVGHSGSGTLKITNGGAVSNSYGCLGYYSGSMGMVTVGGAGSTWTNSGSLRVGYSGEATLNITDGGAVSNTTGYVGSSYTGSSGPTGMVTVSGAGSTWTNSDDLWVGDYFKSGRLAITDGGTVTSSTGYIGRYSASRGEVTVSGAGSTWTNSGNLYVRYSGRGTLNITDGGTVSNSIGYISAYSGSTMGVVTVSGAGSTWNNTSSLYVGCPGSGMLNIADGGVVTAASVSINSKSLLAIEVTGGSLLSIDGGSGTITNNGTVRIIAGAAPTAGATYTPISAGTWTGTGIYQAIGGTWDVTGHTFTASAVEAGTSGTLVSIDLANIQRVLISDTATGWSVGASFLAMESSTPLDLTTTAIDGEVLTGLEDLLHPNELLLGGWEFTASGGYSPGDPAYLSFAGDIGQYGRQDVQVWYYDGADWAEYDAWDLTYDGTYASFTVTGFSGYAVTVGLIPGDADRDHDVDEVDAAMLAAHWGQSGGWADGDFDGDGVVGPADAAILAAHWYPGTGAEQAEPPGAVPEPGSIVLLLGLGVALLRRRRCHA